jgi:Lrp/AsnC family leucine-responsive transcriptional regulator
MAKVQVDRYDLELLAELQCNGRATNSMLGDKVHLSTSQVSRRVQRLEETHIIDHYAAMLDPEVVGLGVMAFAYIILGQHGDPSTSFEKEVSAMPEVLECFSVTGEADYILRIVAPDLASFSEFMMKRLLRIPGVLNVKSNITLEKIKQTNVLPLEHVIQPAQSKQRLIFAT